MKKNSIIKENSFNTLLTFENTGKQFEWIIISLIPVLSKEHKTHMLRAMEKWLID